MKKWYVFDEADSFDSFNTLPEAVAVTEHLSTVKELDGVHIVQMTVEQFIEYCKSVDLKAALAI